MIELDVQLSRDGELVVLHDLSLERTTNGTGLARERDLAALRSLDAGSWFGPNFAGLNLLSLEEVIDIVAGRARLNVEVKAPAADWSRLATRLTDVLAASKLLDATIVSCFEMEALLHLRRRAQGVRIGILWQQLELSEAWDWAGKLSAASIHPHWMLVSAPLVEEAHARGLRVFAWTVNDVETMRHLVHLGVDGIMSDCPERFAAVQRTIDSPEAP